MFQAFGRDEFAAELRTRKALLLYKQDTRALRRKMNRTACARRPSARNHHIVALSNLVHSALALKTNRKGKRRSTLMSESFACSAKARNSAGRKLLKIESAPSSRIKRLCRNKLPMVV